MTPAALTATSRVPIPAALVSTVYKKHGKHENTVRSSHRQEKKKENKRKQNKKTKQNITRNKYR